MKEDQVAGIWRLGNSAVGIWRLCNSAVEIWRLASCIFYYF